MGWRQPHTLVAPRAVNGIAIANIVTMNEAAIPLSSEHQLPQANRCAAAIEAIPFQHEKMDIWRENFTGVETFYEPANFVVFGAVDDIWVDKNNTLMVVDYKATSKDEEVNLDAEWQDGYKRQMEVYQWLLRRNDLEVSDTGYFVYANGKRDREAFDGKLEFDIKLIPYEGKADWIEKTLMNMKKCLDTNEIPKASPTCEYCTYINKVNNA